METDFVEQFLLSARSDRERDRFTRERISVQRISSEDYFDAISLRNRFPLPWERSEIQTIV